MTLDDVIYTVGNIIFESSNAEEIFNKSFEYGRKYFSDMKNNGNYGTVCLNGAYAAFMKGYETKKVCETICLFLNQGIPLMAFDEGREENLKNATDTIYKFVDYCNKQEIEKAYNLITEECKQQMYPTLDAFKNAYYGDVFNGKQRTCTIENWVGDIYKVRMGEDILSTGKDTGYAKEDYITIKKVDNEYKLNINNYIGTTKIEKTTTMKIKRYAELKKDKN